MLLIYATPKFGAQTIKKSAELGWKPMQIMTNVSTSVGAVMQRFKGEKWELFGDIISGDATSH